MAKIRWDQKFINKYDDNPTPSQPKNNCIKLPEVNKITIKKVNKDKYDKNFIKKGSSNIYSVEYKWTNVEIKKTTNNIDTDTVSNKKAQSIVKISILNQLKGNVIKQKLWYKHTSTKTVIIVKIIKVKKNNKL